MSPFMLLAFCILHYTTSKVLSMKNDQLNSELNETNYRLPKNVVPVHYDLKLIPDVIDTFQFAGEITSKIKVLEATSLITLNSQALQVNENATRLTLKNGVSIAPIAHEFIEWNDFLLIRFPDLLDEGEYILHLQFKGTLSDSLYGFSKSQYKDADGKSVWLAITHFEPCYARLAFPCWDEPALKATFNISIKHHSNYTAISNMPVREQSEPDTTDGKLWTHFEKSPIMSTYLVAFVIADFGYIPNADGTINAWGRKEILSHLKYGHEIAQRAAAELVRYTNSTVRVPKMDHVVIPEHFTGAMENWGLITYPERSFVFIEGNSSMERKFAVIETVVHELAHQWFGNVVSPTWWTHIWLNEGFASYFQYYIMDKMFENFRAMEYFVVHVLQGVLDNDSAWHMNPVDTDIRLPNNTRKIFSSVVYRKAPSILHMLSNIISPEVFQRGIVMYLNKHEYSSANPDCLWKALQSAANESDVAITDFNIKEVMDGWIKQKRYPLVQVIRDYSNGSMTLVQKDIALIEAHQHFNKEFFKDEEQLSEWWIPINYATEESLNFSNTLPTHWLRPKESLTIHGIDPNSWVIVNKQQTGYYRVTYDDTNWRNLAHYLKSENFTNIHVLNRAQIINDICELLLYDHIDPTIFLSVVSYLHQETDYFPWYRLFNFLDNIDHILHATSAEPIRAYILKHMENLIKDVGFDEQKNDDRITIAKRFRTLKVSCGLGHVGCKEAATRKYLNHLRNPTDNHITPNEEEWIYTEAMRLVNESDWNELFEQCSKKPTQELLRVLSMTENPVLFNKYLNAVMLNELENSAEMLSYALDPRYLTSARFDVVLDFFKQRWDEIQKKYKAENDELYDILKIAFNEEQVEKGKKLCELIKDEQCSKSDFWTNCQSRIKNVNTKVKKWFTLILNSS